MDEENIEDIVVLIVRLGAISTHFLEMVGASVGTTLVVIMIVEEFIEIYKDRKNKKEKINRYVQKTSNRFTGAKSYFKSFIRGTR
jgi:hypothetical protein